MPLHPANSTLVFQAWLRTIPGLESIVSVTLPEMSKVYPAGWVTIGAAVGGGTAFSVSGTGQPGIYIPERQPVMQVDCWAAHENSEKVDHGRANNLAELVYAATFTPPGDPLPQVTLPPTIKPVWIEAVFPVRDPQWVPEPDSSVAHYSLDIELHWIEKLPVG